MILYGGFALGASKRTPADRERRKALATLMRMEWGADNPAIRQMFANYLMPGATKEQIESFNDLQRKRPPRNVQRAISRLPAIST